MESAEQEEEFYSTKWDIKRAFDSVAPLVKNLAWQRMGVRGKSLELLMSLDEVGRAYPWTPHMMKKVYTFNSSPLKRTTHLIKHSSSLGFRPQRGVGQGDTLSTLVWNAVFDILLYMLTDTDLAYADDLATLSADRATHLSKMDIVSAFCSFTGLMPAAQKIQSFLIRAGVIPELLPLPIRDSCWNSIDTDMSNPVEPKYLGVCVPLTPGPVPLDPALPAEESWPT
jgi:hypothetical protein